MRLRIKELTKERNWFIDWIEQWSQFIRDDDNWYTFTFAHIEFEDDRLMGGYEVTFILLGLGFRWRWNHTRTQAMQDCIEMAEDIKSNGFHVGIQPCDTEREVADV